MVRSMRNINLLTLVVCIAAGLYVYKSKWNKPEQMTPPPAQVAIAPPPTLYKCDATGGGYVYLETPCHEARPAPTQQAAEPVQQQPEQARPSGIDPYTAALAKQADERIARQRREWAIQEQQAAQAQAAQAAGAGATCAALRQEREGILANQRRGGDVQWMNFLNQRFHAVSDALYRNRC